MIPTGLELMTLALRPTAPIARDALLPGDPGRALALAQELLDRPRMCNHHRGLWGYSGHTRGGAELTIQATGIGGPSAAIVLADLARHGVGRAIRLGTCAALDEATEPGTPLLVDAALADEGASRTLGAAGHVRPDPELHARLLDAAGEHATTAVVASVDILPNAAKPERAGEGRRDEHGALAVEMGTATLFALAGRLGVALASALVVTESATGSRLDDAALERASLELGTLAAGALSG